MSKVHSIIQLNSAIKQRSNRVKMNSFWSCTERHASTASPQRHRPSVRAEAELAVAAGDVEEFTPEGWSPGSGTAPAVRLPRVASGDMGAPQRAPGELSLPLRLARLPCCAEPSEAHAWRRQHST